MTQIAHHSPLHNSAVPELIMTPSLPPLKTHNSGSASPAPASGATTPGTLAERVAAMELASSPLSTPTGGAGIPRTASPGSQVLDNGTNIGSASGRKASFGGGALGQNFAMERRGSAESGPARRGSRRGSGVVMTPGGAPVVYHTRTDVSCFVQIR
jgi:hypothetical protein